jgi:mRNA-degrading endonuclease toxin of MazEF toxin-antitoxin module
MKKTIKLFDLWNEQKKNIEFWKSTIIDARVWEFWWYWEGVNVWNEISKDGLFKRVCLILENNLENWLYLVAPITTKYHHRMRAWYVPIDNRKKYSLKKSYIILNQIKLIDKRRISHISWSHNPHCSLSNLVLKKYISVLQKRLPA